ncbi:MAG: DNA cytosine methyltransferase [Methylococcales bacterium]
MKIEAVDLFCGAGGLTHGFEMAGIDVVSGYDIDGDLIRKNYNLNTIKLLAGCAPCQPFSNYRQG